jgi:hypothetical protein
MAGIGGGVQFGLLGPLVVTDAAGRQVEVSGPRLRVLLATLLLHANTPVSGEALVEVVWDGHPHPRRHRHCVAMSRDCAGSWGPRQGGWWLASLAT